VQRKRRHRRARPRQRLITVMGCGGAMPVDKGAWRRSERYARRRGARRSGTKAKKTGAIGAKY
jgi:hypothetical protein